MATSDLNESHITISESISTDPVPPAPFVPNDANLFPKWPVKLDRDAWEEWQVQGLAADGSAAFVVILFRHRLNAPAGFRVGIIASWAADGKDEKEDVVWCSYAALPHSLITSGGPQAELEGVWRGACATDNTPPFVRFDIAADLSRAVFTFNVPDKVVGTVTLASSAGYDAIPRTEEEGRFMPTFWWLRPIPMAGITADLTFFPLQDGGSKFPKALRLREQDGAFGAVERGWTTSSLPKIISHNWWLWARAGPYVIHIIWVQGRSEEQSPLWGSGRLYRDGVLVSAPQRAIAVNDSFDKTGGDTITLEYLHDDSGGIKGAFDLDHVGQLIIFRSGAETWEFRSRHVRTWYNMATSPPGPHATGLSGFVLSVSGGLVNSTSKSVETYSGPGIVGGGTLL